MSKEAKARCQRMADAMHLQEMEGNPLTSTEKAMFEMFEREGWSDERRRAYIIAQAGRTSGRPAAAE